MTFSIQFLEWKGPHVKRNHSVDASWLSTIKKNAIKAFKDGIDGPHSGRIGRRKNGTKFIRSAPNEYPARDSGDLFKSIEGKSDANSVEIGTSVFYSKFLRNGTRMMARRKMSDNALRDGIAVSGQPIGWVKFAKGRPT